MTSDTYRDPQLWPLLDALVRIDSTDLTMAGLAGKVRTETGYAGAYRAIGRLVAAGYAEYSGPVTDYVGPMRIGVRLTARGRSRWQLGRRWPQVVARQIRQRAGNLDGVAGQWVIPDPHRPAQTA